MSFRNTFSHAFYPFKDQAEIDRVRQITREDILAMNGKHPANPNIRLDVLRNDEFEMIMLTDMVKRIVDSDRYDQKVVMIMCNPNPIYRKVAYMLHELKVNCRNVKFYMMDEWADEDGNIAPLSYKAGFGNAFQRFMVSQIMDLAFIDPVEDWFKPTMEEYLQQGAKVASLHPLTIAQNSLHGGFGCSGDISRVPPKGAMMGPRDAMKAKNVLDMHGITTAGSHVTWQRLTSRLCIFGKPSQEVPASILQLRENPTHIIMSENSASTIHDDAFFQY